MLQYYVIFSRSLSIISYYEILNTVPCAIWEVLAFKSHFKKCFRKFIIEKSNWNEKLGKSYTKKESTLSVVLGLRLSIDLLNDTTPTRPPYSCRGTSLTLVVVFA